MNISKLLAASLIAINSSVLADMKPYIEGQLNYFDIIRYCSD